MSKKTIVVSGSSYADALSSRSLVASERCSLVLSDGQHMPDIEMEETLVIGGEIALPLPDYTGRRISGSNRFETAINIAREMTNVSETILVSGESYPDALTSISLASRRNASVVLTTSASVSDFTSTYITENIRKVIIVGGEATVPSHTLEAAIPNIHIDTFQTLIFDENYPGSPQPLTMMNMPDKVIDLEVPTREGYLFAGWYNNQAGEGNPITSPYTMPSLAVNESLTLYANWVAENQGGDVDVHLTFVDDTTGQPVKVNIFIGELRYDSDDQGRVTVQLPVGTHDIQFRVPGYHEKDEEITVVAGSANSQTVRLTKDDPNDGKIPITVDMNYENADIKTIRITPGNGINVEYDPRPGYQLVGWNTKADGSGRSVDIKVEGFTEATTLYAIWSQTGGGTGSYPLEITVVDGQTGRKMEIPVTLTVDGQAVSLNNEGIGNVTLTSGTHTIKATAAGFIDSVQEVTVGEGMANKVTIAMSKTLAEGSYRVILTWGESPDDLDSHMYSRTFDNILEHVYYQRYRADNFNLDVDDTDKYGPETITIEDISKNEIYAYMVHDYSNRSNENNSELANSGAIVKVYRSNQLIKEYHVPQGTGPIWQVFSIDSDGNITDFNRIILEIETKKAADDMIGPTDFQE